MSTVFYGYRIKKQDLWPTVDKIKKFYKEKSPFYDGLAEIACVEDQTERMTWDKEEVLINEYAGTKEARLVELQFFEFEDHYVFRVLERGYFFANNSEQFALESVWYDNRTDDDWDEMQKHREAVDEIDDMISRGHSFEVTIVQRMDVRMYIRSKVFADRDKQAA